MRLLSRTEAVFAQARLRLPIVVEPPSTGQDLSGGTIQGTLASLSWKPVDEVAGAA